MKKLIFTLLFFCSTTATAEGDHLICNLLDNPKASDLKIEYTNEKPSALYLRSPGTNNFRKMQVKIEFISHFDGRELFTARPLLSQKIDWEREPFCYKEIGTMWFFTLNHRTQNFYVQFIPEIITKDRTCVPPKFRPQTHQLGCE